MSKLQNLVKQQPKWNHLPTKATRVPEIFVEQVEKFAHLLDNGSDISYVYAVIEAWDWRKIQELEAKLPALIANKKKLSAIAPWSERLLIWLNGAITPMLKMGLVLMRRMLDLGIG